MHRFLNEEDGYEEKLRRQRDDDPDSQFTRNKFRAVERSHEADQIDDMISIENEQERERLTMSPQESDDEPFLLPRNGTSEQRMEDKVTLLLTLGFIFPPLWIYGYYITRRTGRKRTQQLGKISLALGITASVLACILLYLLIMTFAKSKRV